MSIRVRQWMNDAATGSANSRLSRVEFDPTGVGNANAASTITMPSAAPNWIGRQRRGTVASTMASAVSDSQAVQEGERLLAAVAEDRPR